MVTTHARDDENYLFFTEGCLPSIQTLRSARPKRPSYFRTTPYPVFRSREEAAAWIMSAAARRSVALANTPRHYNYCSGLEFSRRIPYETWVLGPSPDGSGKLEFWFSGYSKETNYRLFICRNPACFEGRIVYPPWSSDRNFLGFKLHHREYANTAELKRQTSEFFKGALTAYKTGNEAGRAAIEQAGHPYWFSAAFLGGPG